MKNVIQPMAKSVLSPLGFTAATSGADAGIHKKILGSGHNTTLIISNDEIIRRLLLEGVSETIKNEAK